MSRAAALALAAVAFVSLPGCLGSGPTTMGPTTGTAACPDSPNLIPGWTAHRGNWTQLDAAQGHEDPVCGTAGQALSCLVSEQVEFMDFQAEVSFNMLAGDSGAGLVVHYRDDQNFNIVRYSPREQGWHIFTVVAGNRQKQDDGSVTPPTTNPGLGEWVHLRVESRNGHIEACDGSTKVIDYTLQAEASHSGKVGYFLRDVGMSALFDDFYAESL